MDSIWRKSSYSGDNGGECVEVATAGAVLVRDTADRGGNLRRDSLNDGAARIGRRALGIGCTVHMPEGRRPGPGWLHQRCARVHGRSAADAGMVQLMVQIKRS
jgi:Domain of unknown function (DUF397)